MPDTKEAGTSYRFCGQQIPHSHHIFWRDHGVAAGGRNYNCMGWLIWQQ